MWGLMNGLSAAAVPIALCTINLALTVQASNIDNNLVTDVSKVNPLTILSKPVASNITCQNPRVRKEWRRLTNAEKLHYTDAVNCLHNLPGKSKKHFPGVQSRYDDFVALHINVTNGSIPIHNNGLFLPWHRWTVWLYETALINECNYTGAQPFWDYYLDGPAFNRHLNQSPVWDATYGMGGNGVVDKARLEAIAEGADKWGTEDVHEPGWSVWGSGDVTPPQEGELTQNVGSIDDFGSPRPQPAELPADPWGKADVMPNDMGMIMASNASQISIGSVLSGSDAAAPSDDSAWGHRRFPIIDSKGYYLDPDKVASQWKARHGRRRSVLAASNLFKRQQITTKAGPPGKGLMPLDMGGPGWPFMQFWPLVPQFLADGLLRTDDDGDFDGDGADDPNDDDKGASEHHGPVGCVITGPFKNWTVYLGPGVDMVGSPRCVKRAFEFTKSEETLTNDRVRETFGKDRYELFMDLDAMKGVNIGPHTNGHRGIGGDMANLYSSTNDPIFFVHHAYIDRLWTLWQGTNKTRLHDVDAPLEGMPPPPDGMSPPTGRSSKDHMLWYGDMGRDRTVQTVLDTMNREGDPNNELCYTYDDFDKPSIAEAVKGLGMYD